MDEQFYKKLFTDTNKSLEKAKSTLHGAGGDIDAMSERIRIRGNQSFELPQSKIKEIDLEAKLALEEVRKQLGLDQNPGELPSQDL